MPDTDDTTLRRRRAYRQFRRGELSRSDLRDVFGDEAPHVVQFARLSDLIEESTTNEPPDGFFTDS